MVCVGMVRHCGRFSPGMIAQLVCRLVKSVPDRDIGVGRQLRSVLEVVYCCWSQRWDLLFEECEVNRGVVMVHKKSEHDYCPPIKEGRRAVKRGMMQVQRIKSG